MTPAQDTALRQSIIDGCLWMKNSGLNQGTSGNISVRYGEGMLITPSGVPYEKMRPDMLCTMPLSGDPDLSGDIRPSTEWRFHQSILHSKPDVTAVVHAHPVHATAIAVQRRPIPACHYMIAAFGGNDVPLVDYALFGSDELARMVADAMAQRTGCIMANHGAVVAGESLDRALWRMEELDNLARVYLLALSTGTPEILTDAQMEEVVAAFGNYGPKDMD
ncbi:class II aldolase/adducin family protein [Neptunicoccus cionae]|uniref:Fructose-bisphosphate aldolase n=1 Tax=Neptunicoccus cionae TaxID=2035344 RepID=A0A916R3Y3_9RHOB|nr:class II aldolase/adducin family protein [Amylibacter cionae]GGA26141.1 fructose-bisphosphate aldolase [Amylibacter cionae]